MQTSKMTLKSIVVRPKAEESASESELPTASNLEIMAERERGLIRLPLEIPIFKNQYVPLREVVKKVRNTLFPWEQ